MIVITDSVPAKLCPFRCGLFRTLIRARSCRRAAGAEEPFGRLRAGSGQALLSPAAPGLPANSRFLFGFADFGMTILN